MPLTAVSAPLCPLMTLPCTRGETADEALLGMTLTILEPQGSWRRVRTPYRYEGWAPAHCLSPAGDWPTLPRLLVLGKNFCDVLSEPSFQSRRLLSLPLGASVSPVGEGKDGWQRIALPDGREGFVRQSWLGEPPPPPESLSQDVLRARLTKAALRYQNAPYRWGGKTPQGIDCSGLVSMAYLLCGVAIWRDAAIRDGFPIHPISPSAMAPGDLLYFPGHVAMYLGDSEYLHATGRPGDDGVRINSLDPAAPHYRADLAASLTAVGSYF